MVGLNPRVYSGLTAVLGLPAMQYTMIVVLPDQRLIVYPSTLLEPCITFATWSELLLTLDVARRYRITLSAPLHHAVAISQALWHASGS